MLPLLLACTPAEISTKDTASPEESDTEESDTEDTDTEDTRAAGDTDDSAAEDSRDSAEDEHPVVPFVTGMDGVLDATPSPDGTLVYLVGYGEAGPGLYQSDGVGPPVTLSAAWTIASRLVLSTDGTTAYVLGRMSDDRETRIYAVSLTGDPTPTPYPELDGYVLYALTLNRIGAGDRLTVAALEPTNHTPGLYTMAASGGAVALVGDGFGSVLQLGVARLSGETTYATVVDDKKNKKLFVVADGSDVAAVVAEGLDLNTSGGMAISLDETTLYLGASADLLAVDIATGTVRPFPIALPAGCHPGGFRRAHEVDRYAIAVSGTESGVYLLDPE